MRKWIRAFYRDQQGASILLVALLIVLLLGMVALVIDGGTIYATKSHLQKTANAAALSAAQELTKSESKVQAVAHQILKEHGEENSLIGTQINMMDNVTISLRKEIQLGFARVLGFHSAPVEVEATAELGSLGKAMGAAPLGIDESIPLEYNKTYTLKVDESGVDHGNFGILGLGGPGAQTYEYNLVHGYDSELKVGDIIDTEQGNIAGKTRSGVNTRISMCPYLSGDTSHRDCSRIILIPVYKPYNHQEGKQLKQVKITGFAYFYILEPMDSKDTSIRGMFIERTGTGFTTPDAANKGAFAIRLTD